MFHRYLLNISYIGTRFRGSQKNWSLLPFEEDPHSVEGNIEIVLKTIRCENISKLIFSSRTDAGVHAHNNTAHIDLTTKSGFPLHENFITNKFNKYFERNKISIIITNTVRVPETFHARFNALSRTYIYRIAVPKKKAHDRNIPIILPIHEYMRLYLIRNPLFDLDKFKESAVLFEGIHDFETFRKVDKTKQCTKNVRTIYSIEINKLNNIADSNGPTEEFDFYNIKIRGKGFVHNQIRRMIGALESVAVGDLTTRDIKIMLQVPSKNSWTKSFVAPPYGLYLHNIAYNPQDMLLSPESL